MSNIYSGLLLAVIVGSIGVFPTVDGAKGLWKKNLDTSTAIRGGFIPGQGESWLCRYIDLKGEARVGEYFISNGGCQVRKETLDNVFESIPIIKELDKVQFLSSDAGASSYAWLRSKDVKNLEGAILSGSAALYEKTYVCRASYFTRNSYTGIESLSVSPGTYYPSKSRCEIPNHLASFQDFEILFDLYSMCNNNGNSQNPTAYKKGTWVAQFDSGKAVQAGQEEKQGEYSYVCRVRKDSKVLLGKRKSSGPACAYMNGNYVEYSSLQGLGQEILVSTPSTLYGWSPQRKGSIGDGAMHGSAASNGEPIFICRALAAVDNKAPRSPGSLTPTDGVCKTPIDNRVASNPKYEVLVDMRRTCDDRKRRALHSGIGYTGMTWGVSMSPSRASSPSAATDSHSEDSNSNYADADEYLTRGFNAVKLALDSYASA